MRRLSGRLPLVLLVLLGTLAGLVLLEVGARSLAFMEERRQGRFDHDLGHFAGPSPRSTVTLGQIIVRSPNPRLIYSLRPRLDVVFAGARLTTSESGHRGRDVVTPKPSTTYRIVGIGDSYMFGQGVSDEETYLARLPAQMKAAAASLTAETVNLAVPGYNTVMEVEALRAHADALQPDMILIEIVGNDLDLPNFLWRSTDFWTLNRSFLVDFVAGRLNRALPETGSVDGLAEAPQERGAHAGSYSRSADFVPEPYRSMVGLKAFEQALIDLAAYARSRRTPVVAVTHGVWFEDDMSKALKAAQIPTLVLRSALRQRARALGAPDYARSPLAHSASDLHPSALGHQAIAEELAGWLKTQRKDVSPPS